MEMNVLETLILLDILTRENPIHYFLKLEMVCFFLRPLEFLQFFFFQLSILKDNTHSLNKWYKIRCFSFQYS